MRHLAFAVVALASCGRSSPWPAWGSSADAGASVDAGPCVDRAITLEKATPTVLFVLDASGSMRSSFGASTRWDSLTTALASALPPVDATMELGALIFPNAPAGMQGPSCAVPTSANLAPALGNAEGLVSLMRSTRPSGETPTADALTTAASILSGVHAATTARALVLATDGAPNCNAALDSSTCTCVQGDHCSDAMCLDDTRTVSTIAGIATRGIPTYVIGIGPASGLFVQVLDEMAVAGGRPLTGGATSYYAATSDTELGDALVAIRNQVGTCEYLAGAIPTGGTLTLTLDGEIIANDATNGWSFADVADGEIVLHGTACATIAATSTPALAAQLHCGLDQ